MKGCACLDVSIKLDDTAPPVTPPQSSRSNRFNVDNSSTGPPVSGYCLIFDWGAQGIIATSTSVSKMFTPRHVSLLLRSRFTKLSTEEIRCMATSATPSQDTGTVCFLWMLISCRMQRVSRRGIQEGQISSGCTCRGDSSLASALWPSRNQQGDQGCHVRCRGQVLLVILL